jgi:type I restriction enzyme S subunit
VTTDAFVEQMSLVAKGSAYPATSFEDFGRAKLIIPSEDLLLRFDQICLSIFLEKENLLQQNQILCSCRDLLLPRLISGKLSVENLDLPSNEKPAPVSSALPQQELAHA